MDAQALLARVRTIPDYPKPGILFYDISTLLKDAAGFQALIGHFVDIYREREIDYFLGIDARGFLLASPLAYELGKGLVLVRKKGKLPHHTHQVTYDLEYGTDTVEIHADAIESGRRVAIIDDLLATGGTALAATHLVEKSGGTVDSLSFAMELLGLPGRSRLSNYTLNSILQV